MLRYDLFLQLFCDRRLVGWPQCKLQLGRGVKRVRYADLSCVVEMPHCSSVYPSVSFCCCWYHRIIVPRRE